MDTAKPSNPSGKVGDADDLIEEMARMMAAGAREKTQGGASRDNGGMQRSPGGAPAGGHSSVGQATQAPTLEHGSVQHSKTSPQSAPPAPQAPVAPAPAPASAPLQGFGAVPGSAGQDAPSSPVPFSTGSPGTPDAPGGEQKSAFKFELGNAGPGSQGNAGQNPMPKPNSPPSPAVTAQPARAPDLSAPGTPNAPESVAAPTPPAAPTAPSAFGAAAQSEPLHDPIADLIRSQSQPAPQKIAAPEPPPRTTQRSSLQAESEARNAGDGFRVPPVFGLGGKPTEPAPAFPTPTPTPAPVHQGSPSKPDALDEIEHLIGNAVHVDFPEDSSAQNAVEKPVQAPSVSQNTSAQPQAESIAPPPTPSSASAPQGGNVGAAEAAILQAMGAASPGTPSLPEDATGPEALGRPAQASPQEALLAGADYQPEKSSAIKRYLVPSAAVLVLVSAGIAGYFMLNSGGADGEAPLLLADGSPAKETPTGQQAGGDNQSVVFNGIEGNLVPESEQRLVSRDQTDGATGSEVRQVITVDNTEAGLANRRVRTVTVRPDGTIISGDDAVAGSEVLPVAQPNLPELPAGAVNTELAGTTVSALPASPDLTGSPGGAGSLLGQQTFAVDGSTVPFPEVRLSEPERQSRLAVNSVARSSGVNTQNPVATNGGGTVDLIASIASDAVAPSPVNVSATTQPATAQTLQPVSNPTNFVQIASFREQGVAQETAANMQARYASALRGGRLEVRRVDLGDRGIFYRVLLPTASAAEASSVCNAIQNAGGDCFPRNN